MDVAMRLRDARREAGLSQADVARRAGTSQPAVAAYESGARRPGLRVLEQLLSACGFAVDLAVQPVLRRGARTLAELARSAGATAPDAASRRRGLRSLFGFIDDYLGSAVAGQRLLIAERPPSSGHRELDAAIAGVAEYLASRTGIAPPAWVEDPALVARPWWFVTDTPALHAYLLAATPAAIAKHGVFLAAEVFDRV